MRWQPAWAAAAVLIVATAGACRRRDAGAPDARPASATVPAIPAAPARALVELCVGAAHSCARAGDGTVACWGDNGNHQVAPSDEAQVDVARVVSGLAGVVALRCGPEVTCGLDRAGDIICTGGDSARAGGRRRFRGALPAVDFTISGYSICARDGGGGVTCFDGPEGTPPLEVAAAAPAATFATAAFDARRVCVTRGDRPPVCFDAQLWDTLATGEPLAVRKVASFNRLAGARALMVGGVDTPLVCGLLPEGRVACDGDGDGDGDASNGNGGGGGPAPPARWALPPGETALGFAAVHGGTTCLRTSAAVADAARAASDLRCFEKTRAAPTVASAVPAGAAALALSEDHACALVDGGVRCWGRGTHGQLGGGSRYLHSTPMAVPRIGDAALLAAGASRACAVRGAARAAITCWGGEQAQDFAPVDLPPRDRGAPVLEIVPGGNAGAPVCARWAAGWWCHAGAGWFPRPAALATASRHFDAAGLRMRSIAADDACGVDRSGRLACVGCTGGDCKGARARAAVTVFDPGPPPGDGGAGGRARFVHATRLFDHGGERFVCGLTDTGRVRCFHAGRAPFEHVAAPLPAAEPTIDALAGVVQIAAGGRDGEGFACALQRDGTVHCWGGGRFGQLGVAPVAWRAAAAPVRGLPPVAEIAVGATFACARTAEGRIYCWGSNRQGGAPDGKPAEETEPVRVTLPW